MDENFVVPFLLILSSLDKALIEKPMLVQVGSFCASNAIWHCSATRFRDQVGRKHLMMNILAAVQKILYSPSQPHRNDQAGSAHTVKTPAFPIPSGGGGSGLQS